MRRMAAKAWLRQMIVVLPLMCRSSYRGVIEFLRDLLGVPVSLGPVHSRRRVRQTPVQAPGENGDERNRNEG
jgi:hypothetical protein